MVYLDATVTACDGAGTVISNNPELVQGIGSRMSGLIKTEPIENVINGIQKFGGNVLDTETASIDYVGGIKKAAELGYKKIAVTTADSNTAKKLRELEAELGLDLYRHCCTCYRRQQGKSSISSGKFRFSDRLCFKIYRRACKTHGLSSCCNSTIRHH